MKDRYQLRLLKHWLICSLMAANQKLFPSDFSQSIPTLPVGD